MKHSYKFDSNKKINIFIHDFISHWKHYTILFAKLESTPLYLEEEQKLVSG